MNLSKSDFFRFVRAVKNPTIVERTYGDNWVSTKNITFYLKHEGITNRETFDRVLNGCRRRGHIGITDRESVEAASVRYKGYGCEQRYQQALRRLHRWLEEAKNGGKS